MKNSFLYDVRYFFSPPLALSRGTPPVALCCWRGGIPSGTDKLLVFSSFTPPCFIEPRCVKPPFAEAFPAGKLEGGCVCLSVKAPLGGRLAEGALGDTALPSRGGEVPPA